MSPVIRMPRGSMLVWAVQKTCSTSSEVNLVDIVYGQAKRQVNPHEAKGDGCTAYVRHHASPHQRWITNDVVSNAFFKNWAVNR